jgi:cell cycle arrest protein BUB2
MKLLRTLPDLNASKIVPLTIELTRKLPDELYDKLIRHPYDPNVYIELAVHKRTDNEHTFL